MTTLYDEHGNIIEPTGDATPVGFCPYCDQRLLALGACPECGKRVTEKNVETDLQTARRMRVIKRVCAWLLMVALTFGVYQFYQGGLWMRVLPTSWLLSFDTTEDWSRRELMRRYVEESLSDAEIDAMLAKYFGVRLLVQSPRPKDIPLRIVVDSPYQWRAGEVLYANYFEIEVNEVYLDDQLVARPSQYQGVGFRYRRNEAKLYDLLKMMTPGVVELTVKGKYRVEIGERRLGYSVESPRRAYSDDFSIKRRIQIEDRNLINVMTPEYSAALADRVVRSMRMGVCGTEQHDNLDIEFCIRNPGVPLQGGIEIIDSEMQVTLFSIGCEHSGAGDRNILHGGASVSTVLSDRNARLGALFTPDPRRAFEAGYRRYFAGTLQWNAIPVSIKRIGEDVNEYYDCERCREPGVGSPDTVEPWSPDESGGTSGAAAKGEE